ncbi:hypothetical protein AB0D86_49880 [Streptomyces sp. NPDC048324]|uniref:hypothetical protein n=1 Tax=Streptomyces sp. NPDC048324 TaxID=3157205 RepID=UPI003414E688
MNDDPTAHEIPPDDFPRTPGEIAEAHTGPHRMAYFLEMLTTPFGEGGLDETFRHWRQRTRTAPTSQDPPDIPRTILGIGDALDFAGCSDFYLQAVQAERGEPLNAVLDHWWEIAQAMRCDQSGT